MSISAVNFAPHIWNQSYNPIMWSISSNQVNQPDFKYVFDLYINGDTNYTYRLKQNPNPGGYGMIDISSYLQPFTDVDLYAPETVLYSNWYANSANIAANVIVKAGEEYSVNGALTLFNGSGATGAPAYDLPTVETGANSTNLVRVLPAALPYQEAVYIMSANLTNYEFWDDYIMSGEGKFLKRQTGDIYVYDYDCHALAFLNWWDEGNSFQKAVQLMQIKQYDATNTLIRTDNIQNTTGNGGGPNTTDAYTSQTLSRDFYMLYFQCGPKTLKDSWSILQPTTSYYTVQAFSKTSATSSNTPGTAVSELVTFRLTDTCTDLYPRVRVSWLNDLGGRDYWNFTMLYQKSTNSQGETYQQANYDYSGQYPVPVSSDFSNSTINDLWLRGGNKSFNKVVQETFTIQTDFLLQEEVDFLGAIPESPQVWIYVGQEGFDIPKLVTVTNVSYTYQTVKQTKLVQATLELSYSKVTKKQNV